MRLWRQNISLTVQAQTNKQTHKSTRRPTQFREPFPRSPTAWDEPHASGTKVGPGREKSNNPLLPMGYGYPEEAVQGCRYRLPLTAERIEQIFRTDPFYVHYAANTIKGNRCIARPDRRSVRSHLSKIRNRMAVLFAEVGLDVDPCTVLASHTTDSNIMVYRLKVTVSFMHISKQSSQEARLRK